MCGLNSETVGILLIPNVIFDSILRKIVQTTVKYNVENIWYLYDSNFS